MTGLTEKNCAGTSSVINGTKCNGTSNGNLYTNGSYTAREQNLDHKTLLQHVKKSPIIQNNSQQDDVILEPINEENYSYEVIKEISDFLLERTLIRPKIGIICGSGLSSLAEHLTNTNAFDYEDIPNFPVSTVEGHVGRLIFGFLEAMPVMAMQGRFHYYEGYPLAKCSMPVRVMKLIGVTHLLATNAAGGLNPKFKVGDIMLVRDHINMMGFAGNNPLQGPNDQRFGPRFPPMTSAYDAKLIQKAKDIAKDMGIEKNVHEGVYTCLGGPNYETVAELRMLHIMGVDAVGMSTVHEVITARHCDLTVFAFSLITNKCATDYDCHQDEANHEEVVSVGKSKQNICGELVCRVVKEIFQEYNLNNHIESK